MAISPQNINSQAGSDISDIWWGLTTIGVTHGTAGTIVAGADSGMGKFPAASDISPAIPSLPNINFDSDSGIDGAVKGQPDAPITATMTGGVIDQIYAAAVSNRLIKAEGPHDYVGGSLLCLSHNPTNYVVNRPAPVRDAGANYGVQGYEVTEMWSCLADIKQFNQVARGAQGSQVVELVANHVGKTTWGETITVADFGVARLWGLEPYWSQYQVMYQTYVGDNATLVVTLDETVASEDGDALQIWQDGVKLVYGVGAGKYQVVAATGVVTFGTAPTSLAVCVMKVMYVKGC